MPLNKVHFHEVSDWDSMTDILLAALVLERLGVGTASTSPIPTGSGRIRTEHGTLPVPAPVTLELLQGLSMIDDCVSGERVTPTGAAILSHLSPRPGLLQEATLRSGGDRVGIITFQVDVQSPEDLATGLDNIRAADGVPSILQVPAFGKTGRVTTRVEILCARLRIDDIVAACFLQTTTIGLRVRHEDRVLLHRDMLAVEVDGRTLLTKQGRRANGSKLVKPEADDVAEAGDHGARESLRLRVANALGTPPSRAFGPDASDDRGD